MTNSEAIMCLCIPFKAEKTLSDRGYGELAAFLNSNRRQPKDIRPDETWDDAVNGVVRIGELVREDRARQMNALRKLLFSHGVTIATRADRTIYPFHMYNTGSRPAVVYGKNEKNNILWSNGWNPRNASFVTGRLADVGRLRSKGYVCISVTGAVISNERLPVYKRFVPDGKLYEAYRDATFDNSPFARSVMRHFAEDYKAENLSGDAETDIWALLAISGGSKIALVSNEPISENCSRRLCASHIETLGLHVPEYKDQEETDGELSRFVELVCYAFDGVELKD